MITERENKFLNIMVEEVLKTGVEDLRLLFLETSKGKLIKQYSSNGIGLFQDFKELISKEFGKEKEDMLTIELISRIYDVVKWLN
jgi:RNase adaptor protein for sRNA GlmZ degradation